MITKLHLAAALAAALALGGCASAPAPYTFQNGRNTPADFHGDIPANNLTFLTNNTPTQAIALHTIEHPGETAPYVVKVPGPAGTLHADVASNHEGAGLTAAGINAGGLAGAVVSAIGVATAAKDHMQQEEHWVRLGFMPVVAEPTLDFWRWPTAQELATPLTEQGPLLAEEREIIRVVGGDYPVPTCGASGPCVRVLTVYRSGDPVQTTVLHFGKTKATARYVMRFAGSGNLLRHNAQEAQDAPNGVPIGDNGIVQYGIVGTSGLAYVVPGVLPDNAYWSQAKMAALVAKDPAVAHWYAVFNTPDPAHPGQVLWTVMHAGKVVGTAQIVVGS